MKKWYKSKTVGIALVQILTGLGGFVNGNVDVNGFVATIIMACVLVVNRVYGTNTSIEK